MSNKPDSVNRPERFAELDDIKQQQLLVWIGDQSVATLCTLFTTCQTLANRYAHHVGWWPSSGEIKGAMLQSGYRPRAGYEGKQYWTFERVRRD